MKRQPTAGFKAAPSDQPRRARPRTDRAEGDGARRDAYQPAKRPSRFQADEERAPRYRRDEQGAREGGREGGRGFTVTLDPDIARVFRGDASVNKALRLVLQLMQVVQGPAPGTGAGARGRSSDDYRTAGRGRTGYQGTDESRGFKRKPRFDEDAE